MNGVLANFINETLIQIVPSTLGIVIPFLGAYWIFKIREKTSAEGKIFEIGREIANILQSENTVGPMDGRIDWFIDNELEHIKEKNREKAIKIMLKKIYI